MKAIVLMLPLLSVFIRKYNGGNATQIQTFLIIRYCVSGGHAKDIKIPFASKQRMSQIPDISIPIQISFKLAFSLEG